MKTICFKIFIVSLLCCASLQAMQVKVLVDQPVLPVLTLKEASPVLRLKLIKTGTGTCPVKEITCSLKGTTDFADVASICLYEATKGGDISSKTPLTSSQAAGSVVVFKNPFTLQKDTTVVWVAVRLKDKVDLTHRVSVACTAVQTAAGKAKMIVDRPLIVHWSGFGRELLCVNGDRMELILPVFRELPHLRKVPYWPFMMRVTRVRVTCKGIWILL